MIYKSIFREQEYKLVSQLNLKGKILDVGGNSKSGYHELIKGEHEFTVINLDPVCEPNFFVDIEKKFPFDDNSFNHSICFCVLEHVYEFENAFSEQVRCVKSGGKIVVAAPFMHHIHGSPDDYLRYTSSAYKRMAEKFNCEIESITQIGNGFFSLCFQSIGFGIPTTYLQFGIMKICVALDYFFNKISKNYRRLTEWLPLGYFVVFKKNSPKG